MKMPSHDKAWEELSPERKFARLRKDMEAFVAALTVIGELNNSQKATNKIVRDHTDDSSRFRGA
jgi:hypothetical protein